MYRFFFFQAEDGIRDIGVTGVQTCALPISHHQGFSERSPLCLCSTPPISRTSRCDGPSRCVVSRARPRPARTVSHLADARIRADDEPGLTDLETSCQAASSKSARLESALVLFPTRG